MKHSKIDYNRFWSPAFETMEEFVFLIDNDFNLIKVNKSFLAFTGKEEKDFIGKKCYNIVHGTKGPLSECPHQRMLRTQKFESGEIYDFHLQKRLSVCTTPIYDDNYKLIGSIHIASDITKSKRIEQLKDEFVRNVSHELRTPLSISKEGISLILDEVAGKINKKQKKILIAAKSNIDRLARLIDNLLDISRIESGKLELKKELIDIKVLIKEIASTFISRAKEKCLELRMNYPKQTLMAYADRNRIGEVFTNLLENAVKFSKEGCVEITARENEKDIACAVTDTGIGISKRDLSRIFGKFEQFGRTVGPGEKGTGLGLSIAWGIVQMHKGKIWIKSKPNKGTKVFFTLPKKAEKA